MLSLDFIFNALVAFIFLIYWVVVFITLYHLTRFGIGTQPKRLAAIFLLGAVLLFCVSVFAYANLDVSMLINKFRS